MLCFQKQEGRETTPGSHPAIPQGPVQPSPLEAQHQPQQPQPFTISSQPEIIYSRVSQSQAMGSPPLTVQHIQTHSHSLQSLHSSVSGQGHEIHKGYPHVVTSEGVAGSSDIVFCIKAPPARTTGVTLSKDQYGNYQLL